MVSLSKSELQDLWKISQSSTDGGLEDYEVFARLLASRFSKEAKNIVVTFSDSTDG